MTRIDFEVTAGGPVDLSVFDVAGRRVATLARGVVDAGRHQVVWMGTTDRRARVPSGTYFYTLRQGQSLQTRRMVALK